MVRNAIIASLLTCLFILVLRTSQTMRYQRTLSSLFMLFVIVIVGSKLVGSKLVNAQSATPATVVVIATPTLATTVIAPISLPTATPTTVAMAAPRTYTIREGDTLLSVAVEVGVDLADMGCLLLPTFDFQQPLVIGTVLVVPPPEVLCHRVEPGETVQSIADLYAANADALLAESWNEFSLNQSTFAPLLPGRYVRVPMRSTGCGIHEANCSQQRLTLPIPQSEVESNAFLPWMLNQQIGSSPPALLAQGGPTLRRSYDVMPATWPYGSGHFAWPVAGWLTQGYRYDHRAIDVAANWGTPIAAADRGVVTRAGWNDQGYGMFVVIDHNIDYVTLYGHLSRIFVEEGNVVAKGQLIGAVGSTGNSTGPHLHFEIRDFGRLVNPLELLGK